MRGCPFQEAVRREPGRALQVLENSVLLSFLFSVYMV